MLLFGPPSRDNNEDSPTEKFTVCEGLRCHLKPRLFVVAKTLPLSSWKTAELGSMMGMPLSTSNASGLRNRTASVPYVSQLVNCSTQLCATGWPKEIEPEGYTWFPVEPEV